MNGEPTMKRTALWIALMFSAAANAAPWTYRGTLNDGGAPANGRYDIRLSLLDAGGAKSLAYPLTFNGVEVKNGSFAIDVDFGMDLTQFGALKLKTEVAQGGSGFVALGEPKAFDAKAALAGVCWDTEGNAGTDDSINFIGTTDSEPLVIKTSGARIAAFQYVGSLFGGPLIVLGDAANQGAVAGGSILGGGNSFDPNIVSGDYGTVSGGRGNQAKGGGSHVGGGISNRANGYAATTSGGVDNCAGGDYSWAGGRAAQIRSGNEGSDGLCHFNATSGDADGDQGSFVWAGDHGGSSFTSTGPNQFLVRSDGGVGINGTPAEAGLEFNVFGTTPFDGFVEFGLIPKPSLNGNTGERVEFGVGKGGTGTNDADLRIAHRNNGIDFFEHLSIDGDGSVIVRSNPANLGQGVQLLVGAGAWSTLSDRHLKTDVQAVDARVQHIGPMAQDFAAAFGVGENDTTISTVDADGVALAAIQGLNAKLEAENATLKSQLSALADRLARLEAAQAP
jgi:hypothetical protein